MGFGFGARLSALRKEKGLTQEELGKGLGTDGADCSKSVVYGWEKEQHYPRVDQLHLICGKLHGSADHLVLGRSAISTLSAEVADIAARINDLPKRQRDWMLETIGHAFDALASLPQNGGKEAETPTVVEQKSPRRMSR